MDKKVIDIQDQFEFKNDCTNQWFYKDTKNTDLFYSETNMAHIRKSVQELREGKGTVHELIYVDDKI